jgi:cell pole-organizing protein PopZ
MEEILASIRQIIESNEPGAGRALSASLPPVYGDDEDDHGSDIHLTVDQAYAGVEFPDPAPQQTDPRFVAANSAGSAPAQEAPRAAMSLADVAARVRAASERNTLQPQREPPLEFRQQPAPVAPAPVVEERPQQVAEELPVMQHAAPAPQRAPEPVLVEEPAPMAFEMPSQQPMVAETETVQPAAAPAQEQVAIAPPMSAPPMSAPPMSVAPMPSAPMSDRLLPSLMEETQQSLLSQDAGLQIARSFEELAAAIDGAERRSLDEIAEDMLRPMLRDWLDDNLPTLVERLVREEIERVARGPRR